MDVALAVITTTVVGLMVGVELAVAVVVNPILSRLPTEAGVVGRAHGARMLGRAMPVWYVGSLVLVVTLGVSVWGTPASVAALVGAALLAISVVMSILLLVPINNQSLTWTPDDRPDDWRDQQRRWDALHSLRVAVIIVAFALVGATASLL
ncbi:MAG TPA: DUF1772 domain-containing protein [Candidatus Janibacter merdipullorum]|nr:DUF1772 domain-containing protein [Candidatus Janibacter merdipullorum]